MKFKLYYYNIDFYSNYIISTSTIFKLNLGFIDKDDLGSSLLVADTDKMILYVFHYFINDIVDGSPRYENTTFLNVLLKCRR